MFDKLEILQMAQAMATHAATRQGAIAENVANADTPGYRARDLASFAETYRAGNGAPMRATRNGHLDELVEHREPEPLARARPGSESPNGNTVSLELEMVAAADVKREHDLALAIYQTSMGILRTGLGRRA
ncbi:FlgB family protein [Ostreiculturibacter nitratireducens]|uniref:FlgB family protein n=1 Tax=Ostreiculturibacter nitratireducens TaxID=3075226 RepID=UPI0031B597D1